MHCSLYAVCNNECEYYVIIIMCYWGVYLTCIHGMYSISDVFALDLAEYGRDMCIINN